MKKAALAVLVGVVLPALFAGGSAAANVAKTSSWDVQHSTNQAKTSSWDSRTSSWD